MSGQPETDRYAVVLPFYGEFDLKEASAALAAALRQPRVDVAMQLRRNPGVPFDGVALDVAVQIAEILGGLGIPAETAPSSLLPALPRSVRVEGATLDPTALVLRLPGGAEVLVEWSARECELLAAVVVLHEQGGAAARALEEAPADDAIAQLAASYQRSHAAADWRAGARERVREYLQQDAGMPRIRLEVHADIALTTGELYRISSGAFEFRCLGEEAMSSSLANMGLLLRKLDGLFSADAPRSEGWLALAVGDLAGAAYASLEDYERWLRWRLARADMQRRLAAGDPVADDDQG